MSGFCLSFNDNIVDRNKGGLSQILDLEGLAALQLAKPKVKQREGRPDPQVLGHWLFEALETPVTGVNDLAQSLGCLLVCLPLFLAALLMHLLPPYPLTWLLGNTPPPLQ